MNAGLLKPETPNTIEISRRHFPVWICNGRRAGQVGVRTMLDDPEGVLCELLRHYVVEVVCNQLCPNRKVIGREGEFCFQLSRIFRRDFEALINPIPGLRHIWLRLDWLVRYLRRYDGGHRRQSTENDHSPGS